MISRSCFSSHGGRIHINPNPYPLVCTLDIIPKLIPEHPSKSWARCDCHLAMIYNGINPIPPMQDFVIGIPKGLFSNVFFTSQCFRLYQFNGKFFCAKIKLDFLVIFPNWPKFSHLLLTDLKNHFFKVYFFNRFFEVLGRWDRVYYDS